MTQTLKGKTGLRKAILAVAIVGGLASGSAWATKDVTIAVGSNFTSLDPYDANDTLSQAVAKSFYQGLFGFDKNIKLVNVLAESYTVSKDGLVYTIKLHPGVKFSDGTDFNAAAVKVNLDRASNPDSHLKRYNLFKNIDKTDVVDANTVKITLKTPFSAFINNLAHPSAVMISPAALTKYGKDIGFHPVGTGPYVLDQWNQTDFVKVKKFDGYWKKGEPKLDTITFRPVADNNTRAAMLQTGEADFAFPVPYEQAALLEKNSKLDLVSAPSILHRYISFNVTQKPFDNLKVLLKEAGYPNGFTTTLWSSHNSSTAQKVIQFAQQQLAQVGIKVTVTAMDAAQRAAQVENVGQKESGLRMFYTGWSASTGEADWALTPLFATQSAPPKQFNTAFYSNPQVDKDLSDALKTTDKTEKAKLYADAQSKIWADAPWAFLVTERLVSANNKRLTGFYVMPDTSFNFDNADIK